jgi:acetyltransferase-like isoleucine patch superfamily enzyme
LSLVGDFTLAAQRACTRAAALVYTVLVRGAFASFGDGSRLSCPTDIRGAPRIAVGRGVYVGPGSVLQVIRHPSNGDVVIRIGDGTRIAGGCVLSGVLSLEVGKEVLMARQVYIADHAHRFDQLGVPVHAQGLDNIKPVRIGDGAWIGENAVIFPGVTIGKGAVIGANAVVRCDVPDRTVAAGVPAKIIRPIAGTAP